MIYYINYIYTNLGEYKLQDTLSDSSDEVLIIGSLGGYSRASPTQVRGESFFPGIFLL